jgi:shikimate kinase
LVLVGLMGAGKTTIGRRLAERLALPFIDADDEIEKAAGCSIEEIFAEHGEAAFRAGEQRVIARLLEGPVHVQATGGGAFMNPETRQRIRDKALSIWLRADLEVLFERVSQRHHRPLLKGRDPRQALTDLMAERYPIYGEADIVVDTDRSPHARVVSAIISALAAENLVENLAATEPAL